MLETILPCEAKTKHWREVFVEQAASGKSIGKFCREHQINHHTFRYWRSKFLKDKDLAIGKCRQGRFMAVKMRAISGSCTPQIFLPNGVTIDLGCGLDSNFVNQFLLNLCGVGLAGGQHAKS